MSYLGEDIPKLGFGLMRLPKLDNNEIDIEQTKQMVDAFLAAGGTYFDTARLYNGSEAAIRQALVERYPRDSYYLVSKLAPWAGAKTPEEAHAMFETSLAEAGVDYFDFYLIHNIGDKRTQVFDDFDLWNFVIDLKAQGKVKHIGFSIHDSAEVLERMLQEHPEMEFVQIQVNYADWENSAIQSRKLVEMCQKYDKPIVIMEPVRGGMLANPPEAVAEILKAGNPDATPVEWALRFALGVPNLMAVLSGASTLEQMEQNLATWKNYQPLNEQEQQVLRDAQQKLDEVMDNPCTNCRYCMKECPANVHIAAAMKALNTRNLYGMDKAKGGMSFESRGFGTASDCLGCGQCEGACPQHISIVSKLEEVAALFGV